MIPGVVLARDPARASTVLLVWDLGFRCDFSWSSTSLHDLTGEDVKSRLLSMQDESAQRALVDRAFQFVNGSVRQVVALTQGSLSFSNICQLLEFELARPPFSSLLHVILTCPPHSPTDSSSFPHIKYSFCSYFLPVRLTLIHPLPACFPARALTPFSNTSV